MRSYLEPMAEDLVGLTSLAEGADQMFAEEVYRLGGRIRVILPFANYETRLASSGKGKFLTLLASAWTVRTLQEGSSDERSYLNAGRLIARECDRLLVVWDGLPSRGLGGTADIVAYARTIGRPVDLIDVSTWRR
jgi:hypothetical protein